MFRIGHIFLLSALVIGLYACGEETGPTPPDANLEPLQSAFTGLDCNYDFINDGIVGSVDLDLKDMNQPGLAGSFAGRFSIRYLDGTIGVHHLSLRFSPDNLPSEETAGQTNFSGRASGSIELFENGYRVGSFAYSGNYRGTGQNLDIQMSQSNQNGPLELDCRITGVPAQSEEATK